MNYFSLVPLELGFESKPHNRRDYKRKYEREIVRAEEDVPNAGETEWSVCRCDAMHMCKVEVSNTLASHTHIHTCEREMRSGTYARAIACPEKDDDVCVIISLFSTRSRCSPLSPHAQLRRYVFAMTQNSPLTMNQFRDGVTFHNYVTWRRA